MHAVSLLKSREERAYLVILRLEISISETTTSILIVSVLCCFGVPADNFEQTDCGRLNRPAC